MSSKKTTKTTKPTTAKKATKGADPTPMREDGRTGQRRVGCGENAFAI